MDVVEHVSHWQPYICKSTSGTVYLSTTLALFVSTAAAAEVGEALLQPAIVLPFLTSLQSLLERLADTVGKHPPITQGYKGRSICEVDFLDNAAGLAHHGRAGFACGPAFLKESLASFQTPTPFIHQCFGYEACRNFIFPEEFTPPFKYACLEGDECWGWLNQGFVNITACLLLSDLPFGVGFNYYGQSSQQFRASMEGHVEEYVKAGGAITFEDVFLHERLPWAKHQSLDNVYSGVISILFRECGGVKFLKGFFASLPLLRPRCPASVKDFVVASENFYLACSIGAGKDLFDFFKGLQFPIDKAREHCEPLLVASSLA